MVCPSCRRTYEEDSRFCPHDGARLRRPSSQRLGARLGDQLRVDSFLGQGAMGVVFRGFQLGVDRQVAIKLLHPELAGDADLRARFLAEARAAARLSGPHIAAVHLVGETDDGVPFIAMELVEGGTLEQVLEDGALDPARAVALAGQIALALADAHEHGVVHRDLKPANIVVDRRRDGERAVVLDFGVAKLEDAVGSVTREGAMFGTPSYLAPEQARGRAVPASDLYSLGVILYRLLSGRLPFVGTSVEVVVAHMVAPAPPLAVPKLDRDLEALVMRCLAKDPADRPAGAAELAAELAAIGRRLRRAEHVRPPARRLRRRLAIVAALAVSAAAGAGAADRAAAPRDAVVERAGASERAERHPAAPR